MRSSTGAAQPGILSSTRSAAYVASARIPGSWANRHPYDYILQAFPGIVSGTKLHSELETHSAKRYCLNCRTDRSLSHHVVQCVLPDQPDVRPAPAILHRGIMRGLRLCRDTTCRTVN